MRRTVDGLLKLLLPALVVVNVSLVWFDVLEPGEAVLVVVGVELLALLVGGQRVFVAVRRYRHGRGSGMDAWQALEDGLTALLPRPVARMVVSEPRLLVCLARWASRRTGLREGEFSYHGRSVLGVFVLVLLPVLIIETLLIELLIPWFWLRVVHLALIAYALIWALGLHASLVTLPHRLEESGIRLRYGTLAEGFIPYAAMAKVRQTRSNPPGRVDGLQVADGAAHLAVGSRTDVVLELSEHHPLHGFFRPTEPVNTIHLAADDPGGLVRELEKRVRAGKHNVAQSPSRSTSPSNSSTVRS